MSDKHNQVNRYDLVSGYMQKWPEGEFVYYSDYVEILAERDADKALIAESVVLFETLRQRIAELYEHGDIVAMLATAGITLVVGE